MEKKVVFVVEDEGNIREFITYNIKKSGYVVHGFESSEKMFDAINSIKPSLILLDIMLPGMDGLATCEKLKRASDTFKIPIIMLTAKGEEADIVKGLELGADDYIVKPFSPKVLIARMNAIFRRYKDGEVSDKDKVSIAGIEIDSEKRKVKVLRETIELTFSEFEALRILASNPGLVYTRYNLIEKIHGDDYPVTDRSVDVMIVSLRKKMGELGELIETVRGVGYRFKDVYEE